MKLTFPVIKGPVPQPKVLSMDQYVAFVMSNLRHTFDRKAYERRKRRLAVNIPFRLK